jgi:TRAP-type C4-dicarboxylate transport system permease large subunit
VPLGTMFRGVLPFWGAMMVCVLLLVAFPQIATFLPQTMFGR